MAIVRAIFNWVTSLWLVFLVAVVATTLAYLLRLNTSIGATEFELQTIRQADFLPIPTDKNIVIVVMGEHDSQILDQQPGRQAISRIHHADLIAGLNRAHASALLFDIYFDESHPGEDEVFEKALISSSPLKISMMMTTVAQKDDDARMGAKFSFAPPVMLANSIPSNIGLGQCIAVNTGEMTADVAAVVKDEKTNRFIQSCALITYRQILGIPASAVDIDFKKGLATVARQQIQIDDDGGMIVNFASSPNAFEEIRYPKALEILAKGDPVGRFKNKIVIVENAQEPTLNTVRGQHKGSWIIASALNTLFQLKVQLWRQPIYLECLWAGFLAFSATFAVSRRRWLWAIVVPPALTLLAWFAPIAYMLATHQVMETYFGLITLAIAIPLSLLARAAIPRSFPLIRARLVTGTVMFVDLKDSTPLVARLGPTKSQSLLSDVLFRIRKASGVLGGEVINELGDGAMILFGGSGSKNGFKESLSAVAAIQRVATELSQKYSERLEFTFGIEAGRIERSPDGLHGITVHTASRLQAACRSLAVDALIGATAQSLDRQNPDLSPVGSIQMQGLESPIIAYSYSPK